jgi:ABC-type branched-subunit amino acid transport system permease subunit
MVELNGFSTAEVFTISGSLMNFSGTATLSGDITLTTAAIIGGIGNVYGAILGALLLGLAENFGIWYLPSGYKDAIAFVILFIFSRINEYTSSDGFPASRDQFVLSKLFLIIWNAYLLYLQRLSQLIFS